MRDSGNVVVKNWYTLTKSEKSFHFDLTQVAHISARPYHVPVLPVPLFLSHHLPLVHQRWGNRGPLCKALFRTYFRDRDKLLRTVGITGLRENFGWDDEIEEPHWGPLLNDVESWYFICLANSFNIVHEAGENVTIAVVAKLSPKKKDFRKASTGFEPLAPAFALQPALPTSCHKKRKLYLTMLDECWTRSTEA